MADFTSISDLRTKVQAALDAYPSLLANTSPYVQLGLEDNIRAYHKSSVDLVKNLSEQEFNVTVSAYPEKHPDALSFDQDIEFLKRKIDAGASQVITQFCFDFEFILSYRDLLLKHNINIPIIPGIMPTTNFKGIQKMSKQCSTSIPEWLENKYNGLEDSLDERKKISKEIAVDFCQKLISNDFKAIHFYTLNQSELTLSVCQSLNISDE